MINLKRVVGHPHLRKDRNGVIHNMDKNQMAQSRTSKEVIELKKEVESLKKLIIQLTEKT